MPAFAFPVLGLQASAPIASIFLHGFWGENSGPHAFMTVYSHVELLLFDFIYLLVIFTYWGSRDQPWNLKNHHSAYHRGSEKVNSMTVVTSLKRLCAYALVWIGNLILYSLLSPNTRCLIKLWIEILNIWIYLRIWSRSLMLGMYAFRTRFTFIVLGFSSFLFEFYKIYDTIDSIIQFSWIKWLFKCRFGILKGE